MRPVAITRRDRPLTIVCTGTDESVDTESITIGLPRDAGLLRRPIPHKIPTGQALQWGFCTAYPTDQGGPIKREVSNAAGM